jgi:hypothetical protein
MKGGKLSLKKGMAFRLFPFSCPFCRRIRKRRRGIFRRLFPYVNPGCFSIINKAADRAFTGGGRTVRISLKSAADAEKGSENTGTDLEEQSRTVCLQEKG